MGGLDRIQGCEQAKKRAVIERPGWKHHVRIEALRKTGRAITEQVRTISASRLCARPVGRLSADEITEVRLVLTRMFDL